MLKIGEFSQLTHVTVKALRHYAQLGLLKPAWVDRYNGYRYYSVRQMPRLQRILVLKEMGFSLDEIAGLLNEDLPVERLRELLCQKQVELRSRVQAEQQRLAQVEARLKQMEREPALALAGVTLKAVGDETLACLLHSETEPQERAWEGLYAWMELNGYRAAGSPRVAHLNDNAESSESAEILEVRLPVERLNAPSLRLPEQKNQEDAEMEPKIVSRPAFMVMGMLYRGKNQNDEISKMWDKMIPRFKEVPAVGQHASYGVCYSLPGATDGEFEYVAGLEVASASQLPQDMVVRMVPEQTYAVFTHRGSLAKLHEAMNYIYRVWLPQSGYKLGNGPDFEFYEEGRFTGFGEQSELDIYVPIQK